MSEKQQEWFCENCKAKGSITYQEGEGVYAVIVSIGLDHNKVSPDCQTGIERVRAIREEKRGELS